MSWSLKFDEPIALADGKPLRTLRDAATHIIELPPRESALAHWQTAMSCLLSAAEKQAPVMMARIAMLQALAFNLPKGPEQPPRKAPKKYRIVR